MSQKVAPLACAASMTPPSSSAKTTCTWRARRQDRKRKWDKGCICPILVFTIKWDSGDMIAKRMMKGTARKIEVILSKIQKITLFFQDTAWRCQDERKRPATSPRTLRWWRKELSYKELGRWLFPSLPDQPSPSCRHLVDKFESTLSSYCPPSILLTAHLDG